MAARHHIDGMNKLIITEWKGDADVDKLIKAYKHYQKKIRNTQELAHYNEIVNFSNIGKLNFNFQDLKRCAKLTTSYDSSSCTKLALIVNSRRAYVLAMGYVLIRKLIPVSRKQVKVFYDYFDALKWLNRDS